MRVTPTPVTALVVGDLVTLDGTLPALTVVKVGRGLKVRNVTYRRADGFDFLFAHQANTLVDVVTVEPSEQPVGADVLVTGTLLGYRGRVERTDKFGRTPVVNGRNRWFLQAQDRVQVLALDGSSAALEAGDEPAPSAWYEDAAPATAPQLPAASASSEADNDWALVVSGQGGDSCHQFETLTEALDLWREVLETQPLADLRVLHNGSLYADVEDMDTCSIHRDAVFSKDGPCPVCVTDEEDPAAAEAAGDSRTAAVLRTLLERRVLTSAETDAVNHAIYVLEG